MGASYVDVEQRISGNLGSGQQQLQVVGAQGHAAVFLHFTKRKRRERPPNLRRQEGRALARYEGAHRLPALVDDTAVQVVAPHSRGRSGARRIGEHMQVSERKRFDEPQTDFVLLVCLTRKTHHHVGADPAVGHLFMNRVNALGVVTCPVTAVHGAQNAVAAAL